MNLEEGRLYWLIKVNGGRIEAIGFMREQWIGWVIASPTGSYGTGHRENWRSKLEELLADGYVEESVAKGQNLISSDWQPPELSKRDKKLANSISERVKH
jgi:hypothetical protein